MHCTSHGLLSLAGLTERGLCFCLKRGKNPGPSPVWSGRGDRPVSKMVAERTRIEWRIGVQKGPAQRGTLQRKV